MINLKKDKLNGKIISISKEKILKAIVFRDKIISTNKLNPNKIKEFTFQQAKIQVKQKFQYLKTCIKNKLSIEQIFKNYPFSKLYYTQELISQKQTQTQNPQLQRCRFIQTETGLHFIQDMTNCQQKSIQSHKQQNLNGISISLFKDGSIFQGYYHKGLFCGYGTLISQDMDIYVGRFKSSQKQGYGVYYWLGLKQSYSGQWQNDLPHGQGVSTTLSGIYTGSFTYGLKSGFGQQDFANGNRYTGQYLNNIPHGYGQFSWSDSSNYKGDFLLGVRHGYGTWQDQQQSYCGWYKNDKKHGWGVYTWKGNKQYKGHFQDGLRSGYGQLYTDVQGTQVQLIYKGGWQQGHKKVFLIIQRQVIQEFYRFLDSAKQFWVKNHQKRIKSRETIWKY